MTIAELIREASEELKKINIDRATFEARLLLAHVMSATPEEMIQRDHERVSSEIKSQFKNLIQRRTQFEPVAYLLGYKEFFGRKFDVNSNVLIPRPETESLVHGILGWIQQNEIHSAKILELGTGSGCIAVSLAAELGESFEVTAVDISEEALKIANQNAKQNDVNVHFLKADMLAPSFGNWNVIVSNPPYIPAKEIPTLQLDILNFEPHLALEGGDDGLKFLKVILNFWSKHLTKPGLIALETHGPEQISLLSEATQNFKTWQNGPHLFAELI
ncbi:MAG: peptide chain release factor N(5)-glutamine methyltransferase [Deltaproteobacteria bacterium]|nr:peptide chain release factor N(5)-glutamine methyltransferase [Deltaproteobacteria bacterium]